MAKWDNDPVDLAQVYNALGFALFRMDKVQPRTALAALRGVNPACTRRLFARARSSREHRRGVGAPQRVRSRDKTSLTPSFLVHLAFSPTRYLFLQPEAARAQYEAAVKLAPE